MAKGKAYWQKRFEQLNDALLRDAVGYYGDVERMYRDAMNRIEKDIAQWYTRLAVNNEMSYAEAKKLLTKSQLEDFKMTLEEYIRRGKENGVSADWSKSLENASAKFHISRLEALQLQIQQHLEELYGNQLDGMDATMRNTYRNGYYRTAYELQKGFQTGFDVQQIDGAKLEKIMGKPWAVDGLNFSDRIWGDKDKLLRNLQSELVQGLVRGDGQLKITQRFAKRMNSSLSNAGRLIATESAYFGSLSEKDSMKDLGVEQYEILATLDSKTSEICRGLDGHIFKMSEFQPGITAPPFHPWCRSCTVPHVEGLDGGLRAARGEGGKTEYVPGDMTYREWRTVFVDKKITLDAWYAQWKYVNTTKELQMAVRKAATAATAAKTALGAIPNHTYHNIWKDDVTVADWGTKKGKIPAKKAYFEEQITAGNDVAKFKLLQQQLEEFNTLGREYAQKLKAYKAAQESLVQARLELEKHIHGGKTDPYSEERKERAYRFTSKKDADAVLRSVCGDVWRNATQAQKNAIFEYTCGSGRFNRPLAGFQKPYYEAGTGWEPKYYKGSGKVWIDYERAGDEIRAMTALIEQSKYSFDIWLQRGCNGNAMESFLQLKSGTFYSMSQEELQQFVGRDNRMDNFISTAGAQGAGFSQKEVILNIYAPAGTEMAYAEPFSNFGSGSGVQWDGIQKQSSFGGEFEVIIQRGAQYRITKIERKEGKIYVDMEVHPEMGYNKYQEEDSEWDGSRIDYMGKEH